MRIVVCDTPDEAADLVAGEILSALERKPDFALGLATGSTPIGVYERLVRAHREEGVDFSRMRTFNLDEYLGLAATTRGAIASSCESTCSAASICRSATSTSPRPRVPT